jgi:hypothetical protein
VIMLWAWPEILELWLRLTMIAIYLYENNMYIGINTRKDQQPTHTWNASVRATLVDLVPQLASVSKQECPFSVPGFLHLWGKWQGTRLDCPYWAK